MLGVSEENFTKTAGKYVFIVPLFISIVWNTMSDTSVLLEYTNKATIKKYQ